MTRSGTLLCVHPHPDDESISCGGVLARSVASGRRTIVVTCTGGEEGENLAGIDLGGRALEEVRREELADALTALGVEHHHWLGYRDSGMVDTAGNAHVDSFHRADLEEAATRLATILRQERPDVVVSDDEHGTYGHPDHIKAYAVTVRAVELAADPDAAVPGQPWRVAKRYVHALARGRLLAAHRAMLDAGLASPFGEQDLDPQELTFGVDDEAVTTIVEVADHFDRKQAALRAHRSQIGEDSFFLNTPEELAGAFFGVEEFVLEAGEIGPNRPESDLFDGVDLS